MLNILSILTGLVALIFVIAGLVPLLGWMNWIGLPITVVGLVLGILSRSNTGRNLNIALVLLALVRGSMFGGLI
ncbi:MAG: hypothetical protein U5M50_03250 [Sphingobium sp.]|nr:hypothetical protein [Sphingobium sp.]